MGHDIYARKLKLNEDSESVDIAYLRATAFDSTNSRIYELLDAADCFGGVSGLGVQRFFKIKDILNAYERSIDFGWAREKEFLEKIIESKNQSIEIYFG